MEIDGSRPYPEELSALSFKAGAQPVPDGDALINGARDLEGSLLAPPIVKPGYTERIIPGEYIIARDM